jgi:hypothetical protein
MMCAKLLHPCKRLPEYIAAYHLQGEQNGQYEKADRRSVRLEVVQEFLDPTLPSFMG